MSEKTSLSKLSMPSVGLGGYQKKSRWEQRRTLSVYLLTFAGCPGTFVMTELMGCFNWAKPKQLMSSSAGERRRLKPFQAGLPLPFCLCYHTMDGSSTKSHRSGGSRQGRVTRTTHVILLFSIIQNIKESWILLDTMMKTGSLGLDISECREFVSWKGESEITSQMQTLWSGRSCCRLTAHREQPTTGPGCQDQKAFGSKWWLVEFSGNLLSDMCSVVKPWTHPWIPQTVNWLY